MSPAGPGAAAGRGGRQPGEVVLSVRGLSTQYVTPEGIFRAVRDVSFEVRRLERVGIVGESGSGKSALSLSILGLIDPPGQVTAGQVCLNGRDIRALRERDLQAVRGKEISVVFQDPMTGLDPIKPIGDQITEAIRAHQDVSRSRARQLAIGLLRDVEVPAAARRIDDYPHQYSGGMRQRVMIAIALANQPDVLIADEPTTALDVTTQAQVLDLLERLAAERGTAVILITHNLGIVAEFCDTVQVMYAGRVVERGTARQLFSHSVHPYTEALLKAVPRTGSAGEPLFAIGGLPPSLARLGAGCSFEPRCPVGHGQQVCVSQPPEPARFGGPGGEVIAECHFARQRHAAAAGPGGAGQ
ncbi:MAG TPA: ABC transporter ATP-binding protein [Streptosporangiaceae bacterium]